MPFIVGESYTRDDIHAELGGEKVSYLPQKDRRVVCGCFSAERNPEAPHVILVGGQENGEDEGIVLKKARLLAKQGGTISVFLKQSSNNWFYDGPYRVKGSSEDRNLLDEKQRRAGRENVVFALFLEPATTSHHVYLLTWNPRKWAWEDVEDVARRTAEGEAVADRWSCGNTRRIRPGDLLFLLRQGVESRGIVASGWATSVAYEGPHWDASRREQGHTALHVDVRFDRILNPEVDDPPPLAVLQSGPLSSVNWSTPASGI